MKRWKLNNPEKVFFTSDDHFGHANIIKYCHRPFADVAEMDSKLMENWNETVPKDGIVFNLGDFIWKPSLEYMKSIITQLNGTIVLVKGNHDNNGYKFYQGFDDVVEGYLDISVEDKDVLNSTQFITMCHFPMASWNQSHRGAWNLYGHWHSRKVDTGIVVDPQSDADVSLWAEEEYRTTKNLRATQYDVGVDGNDYKPISYYEVKEIINKQIELTKVNNKINR